MRLIAVVGVFALVTRPIAGQDAVLKDPRGEPLPAGAIGRLGSLSFRVAAPVAAVRYLDGGAKLLVKTHDKTYRTGGVFILFDAQTGQELNRIVASTDPTPEQKQVPDFIHLLANPEWCVSPDGRWLVRVDPVAGKAKTKIQVQELLTGKVVATIEAANCHFHSPQFTPDGKSIAVIAAENLETLKGSKPGPAVIRLWNVVSQKEVRTFAMPPQAQETFRSRHFAFSPDGQYLAASGEGGGSTAVVRVWDVIQDLATGKILVEAAGEQFLDFAADSKTVATVSDALKLYDLPGGQMRKVIPIEGGKYWVYEGHFTPDGQIVVMLGYSHAGGKEVRCWHLDRGGQSTRLPFRPTGGYHFGWGSSGCLALTPDSKQIAFIAEIAGAKTPHLILAEIESGKLIRDFGELDAGKTGVDPQLVILPDGKQLAALFGHKLLRWELPTGKELPAIETTDSCFQFAPDGKTLAVADGNHLRLLDATTGVEQSSIPNAGKAWWHGRENDVHRVGSAVAFSPDGKTVALAQGRTFRQWDLASGQEIGPTPDLESIHAIAMANEARWLASCSSRHVQVWDSTTSQVVLRTAAWTGSDGKRVALTALALSADGKRLALGGSDGLVELFDVPAGKRLRQLRFHESPLLSLLFIRNTLTTADNDKGVAVWDAASGELRRKASLPRPEDGTKAWKPGHEFLQSPEHFTVRKYLPLLSPRGDQLLLASDKSIALWEVGGTKTRPIPVKHNGKFAISGDGGLLVAGPNWDESYYIGRYSPLYLIETATGKELRITANFPRIRDFSLSPDGKLLAACGTEGIRLWDTATGTFLADCNGHRGIVKTIAFSPDGSAVVSAAMDGTMIVWDVARLLARTAVAALPAEELKALWNDLAAEDAHTASKAMLRLANHPQEAAMLLSKMLVPASVAKEKLVKLVADLDDARPKVREGAMQELKGLAEIAEPALRTCLAGKPSLEQRRRIELILTELSQAITAPDKLRALRSVEVLALLGTPQALQVLRTIAAGAEGAYETRDARASLRRLAATE